MKLVSGHYFGETRVPSKLSHVAMVVTDYAPQEQPWHTHENPTFFIHLRGDHRDLFPSEAFEQPILSVVYHPTFASHRSSVGPGGMTGLNIELTQTWLTECQLEENDLGPQRLMHDPSIAHAALRLLDSAVEGGVADADNGLVDLVAQCCETISASGRPGWLDQAKDLSLSGCAETVRQIATEIGIHPVHLARVFRRYEGVTVTVFLQRIRLWRAATLMLQGANAGDAAVECGFGDQFYMSRSFHRLLGFRPVRLKELQRLVNDRARLAG